MTRVTSRRFGGAAVRSINTVLILYRRPMRWSFRKVVGTWPDPRSMPRADALSSSSYGLRFLDPSRDSIDLTINGVRRVFKYYSSLEFLNETTTLFVSQKNSFLMLPKIAKFKLFWSIIILISLSIVEKLIYNINSMWIARARA